MCSQLDANNGGYVDPGSSKGLQVGTGLQTCTTQATSTTHHEQKRHNPHTDRDREHGHQRGDSPSGPLQRTISEPNVSGSQVGRFSKTSGELEGLKQVHHTQEVQDGRCSSPEEPLASRGLYGIDRPKRCLLLCDHGPTRLEIAPVQLARSDLRVPNLASGVGPPSDIASGRHVADGSVKGRVKVVHEVSPTTPAAVRIQHQLGQICSLSYAEDSVPRIYGKFSGDVHIASKGESDQNQSGMQSHAESAFHHSAGIISDGWASDSNSSGHSTSSFVFTASFSC